MTRSLRHLDRRETLNGSLDLTRHTDITVKWDREKRKHILCVHLVADTNLSWPSERQQEQSTERFFLSPPMVSSALRKCAIQATRNKSSLDNDTLLDIILTHQSYLSDMSPYDRRCIQSMLAGGDSWPTSRLACRVKNAIITHKAVDVLTESFRSDLSNWTGGQIMQWDPIVSPFPWNESYDYQPPPQVGRTLIHQSTGLEIDITPGYPPELTDALSLPNCMGDAWHEWDCIRKTIDESERIPFEEESQHPPSLTTTANKKEEN